MSGKRVTIVETAVKRYQKKHCVQLGPLSATIEDVGVRPWSRRRAYKIEVSHGSATFTDSAESEERLVKPVDFEQMAARTVHFMCEFLSAAKNDWEALVSSYLANISAPGERDVVVRTLVGSRDAVRKHFRLSDLREAVADARSKGLL